MDESAWKPYTAHDGECDSDCEPAWCVEYESDGQVTDLAGDTRKPKRMNDHTVFSKKKKPKRCVDLAWPHLGLIVARVVSCNSPALAFRTCLPPYSDVLPDLLPWLPSFSAAFAFLLAATSVDSASR